MLKRRHAFLVLAGFLSAWPLRGEVVDVEIIKRAPFAGGREFGKTGAYEMITGIVRFAVDPKNKRNDVIVDLELAPRNAQGKVEFESDFYILAPKDMSKGNGAILYDVNNRGRRLALGFFNRAPGTNNPANKGEGGDGFLFRRGYTVVWVGWIGELLPGGDRLLMKAPIAKENGKPIRGIVRQEIVAESPAKSMPLSRRGGHGSYPPTRRGLEKATLTWRMRETDRRVLIPREQWSLEIKPPPKASKGVAGTLPEIRLWPKGGFRPGYIYELIYEAEGPIVQGLGFAAPRDWVSFLRYSDSEQNPLGTNRPIRYAYGFGVSQSGRFLRNFVYLGFNVDEKGRKVFDGLIPHVAGGGLGFFNHRFAQPNRHNGQHEDHSFPADYFPFTYGECNQAYLREADGKPTITDHRDSILGRLRKENSKLLPKIMHTQSSAEYWHRAGSLVHTDPLGQKDVAIPDNVRIYAFGGTQHGPAGFPPDRGFADNLRNPGDYRPFLRALLDALDAWCRHGKEPPPSVYPKIKDGTLVDWRQEHTRFPALPGIRYPEVIHRPSFYDYGPDFWSRGIINVEPPRPIGHYVVLVPKSDPDGNDLGTLLPAEVAVPLATYTGWNLRRRDVGAEAMLASLMGSYIPFARTKEERLQNGDPRLSIAERYGTYDGYIEALTKTCNTLIKRGYLLEEDAKHLIADQKKHRDLFEDKKR
ncbi:MAG: hypothetical protein KatS3mg105_1690 [Gemmatales bacterium]|nr:MAG: hypothetical protein KatS3mg105_1690 [Gemmatales bacterium]